MGQVIEFVHSQIDCLLSKHSIITHGTTEFHSILRSRERQTGDGHVYFEKKKKNKNKTLQEVFFSSVDWRDGLGS